MTLGELVAQTARRFSRARLYYGHGTDNARDEAAYLVLRGLGLPFDTDLNAELTPSERRRADGLVRSRIEKRIPAAYLLREAWLDGRSFYVDRRVIVPRSHIAELLRGKIPVQNPRRVLDLCTGSGCLAILAALAFPQAEVDASDISPAALAVASKNVARYRLERRIRLVRSDLFDSLGRDRYGLIVANPPYVVTASMRRLPAEYRYEPGISLAGGHDGLELVSRILAGAPEHLSPRGMLLCEVGDNQRAVRRAYPRAALAWPKPEVFTFSPARTAGASRKPPRQTRAT